MTNDEKQQEKKLNKEFSALRAGFRLEFGNQQHTDLANLFAEINKLTTKMNEEINRNRIIEKCRKDIMDKKKKVIWLMGELNK